MPHKEKPVRLQYYRDYYQANREKRLAYFRKYREEHREEIAENETRRVRFKIDHTHDIYLGMLGMTRKQRIRFQQELMNGTTDGSRSA